MPLGLAFVLGFAGSAVATFLPFLALADMPRSEWPEILSRAHWFIRLGSCLIGGGVALLYAREIDDMTWLLAVTVGGAWPAFAGAGARVREFRYPSDRIW